MTYQKSRTKMTIKILLSLIVPFLFFFFVPLVFHRRINTEPLVVYLFAVLLLYPLAAYIFFRKFIFSAYHHYIETEENGFHCDSMYVRGALVNADILYADVEKLELFVPKIYTGAVALRVNIKNEEEPIDIDNKYLNYTELWQTVCDKCKSTDPAVFIDPKIMEKIRTTG